MRVFILILSLSLLTSPVALAQDDIYKPRREKMVRQQIEARGIKDPEVIAAMKKVQRHLFVPRTNMIFAYNDYPMDIGYGQTISQPYIVAYMTELLKLKPNYKVLEVGTGSGYQAAVLAEIAEKVYTIEIIEELSKMACGKFKDMGYTNIVCKAGDGYNGWPEHAPYDAIIVTAAPEEIPAPLTRQLKEGGRMIIPVGPVSSIQKLILIEKKSGELINKELIPVRFVPLLRDNRPDPR
jgi:protein-L-isoaspartate(D-aspartate) O-methyltransferase